MVKKVYKSLSKQYPYERGYCICGKLTTRKVGDKYIHKDCEMKNIDSKFSDEEIQKLELLNNSNLTSQELKVLLSAKKPVESSGAPYSFKGKYVKFGVIGDTHIGHNCYDPKLMKYAADTFNKEKVDFVIHAGDICEGHYENKRQGSIFELSHIGGDAQVEYAVKELSQIKRPILGITGNHETNTFFHMSGFDIGKQMELRLPNFKYLGMSRGIIELPYGKKIEVLHPDGGSSYAISYKSQKIVESLEGGSKPDMLFIGHFHKMEYIFYRNIHTFQTGTLESQTPFMRGKNLSAHKGFWIVEAKVTPKGIGEIHPRFIPAY